MAVVLLAVLLAPIVIYQHLQIARKLERKALMRRGLSAFNVTAVALGLAFLYLPIVILVIYSFNASRLVTVWGGWSTRWYVALLNDSAMLEAAWTSLRIAFLSATAATVLGHARGGGAGARRALSRPHRRSPGWSMRRW